MYGEDAPGLAGKIQFTLNILDWPDSWLNSSIRRHKGRYSRLL